MTEQRGSYSQDGEDRIVAALFGDEPGRLIEIGAWDPFTFSNSRLLIERGWEATLVEFSPGPLRKLIAEYAGNPKVRVVVAAAVTAAVTVTPGDGIEKFRVTDDGLSVPVSNEAHRKTWETYDAGYYGEVWVPTIHIGQLMALMFRGAPVDFASVDTEGSSVEIALDLMQYQKPKPRVICCEYDDRIEYLAEQAKRCGYREQWRNGTNVVMVRK